MAIALTIAMDRSLADQAPEAKYVLRTLARMAGYGAKFVWADQPAQSFDIYYGLQPRQASATVSIRADGSPFSDLRGREPGSLLEQNGLGFIGFDQEKRGWSRRADGVHFEGDIVRASFWLLTGARETKYARDNRDNLDLEGSFLLRHELLRKPLVSQYAAFLREFFQQRGKEPLPLPWTGNGQQAAFAFSHDVDYPQMVRGIEALRLLHQRGLKGLPSVRSVLAGTNHFWRFADWIAFEKKFGACPAFYFSARRGSLLQYATGTPDCFYDIFSPAFRDLFRLLQDEGCEVGLHASYHAHQSAAQIAAERQALKQASGAPVEGNRHHYWRLNPAAPHETLARHEAAGLSYDSSLAFEFYPGFRRGVCHPFHVWHPEERRELKVLQIPPAWMDDHFDRRLAKNHIESPEEYARGLLDSARATGGVAVVDYHVRGMNADFFPRYGPWLAKFAEGNFDSTLRFVTPGEAAHQFAEFELVLEKVSSDLAVRGSLAGSIGAGASASEEADCEVGLLKLEEEPAWEAFVQSHADATVYHTLGWKRATEDGLGHRSVYLRAMDGEGHIVGALPLFEVHALGGSALVSVPLRDKGGPLVRHASIARALMQEAIAMAQRMGAKRVAIKYPPAGLEGAFTSAGFSEERHWVTTVVPVDMGEERLWNDVFRSPTRRAVNKARNSGLSPRWSSAEADLAQFFRLFLLSRKNLGVPPYPYSFFQSIWRRLLPEGHVRLLLVEREGLAQGALLVFPYQREVVSAYMGSNPAEKDARVNDLLFWEAIRWSAEQNFDSFYFGADSPFQEGLLAYKRKWGGRQFAIPNYSYSLNGAAHDSRDSNDPRYAFIRSAFSRLPMPVLRLLGYWVTRRVW